MKIGPAKLMSHRDGFRGIIGMWEFRSARRRMARGEGGMTVRQQAALGQVALRTFERDLPRLWAERPGQWVAYQGDRVLGVAAQKHELYQRCLNQGLSREEFVIFSIEAQETELFLGPMIAD